MIRRRTLTREAKDDTEIHFAAYLPEELAKLKALEQYVEYGQIIFGSVEELSHVSKCDTLLFML